MHVTSRRGFLKIAAAGAAGAALTPALGRAAGKTVTLLHESSFIPPFDEYMKNVLAPAYEKETGVKVVYEIISVGSSPARIASISETEAVLAAGATPLVHGEGSALWRVDACRYDVGRSLQRR